MFSSIGIIGETYTGFRDGEFVNLMNGHHITMFSFFGLNAIVDILYSCKITFLPPDLDFITATLSFIVEGFLFAWHIHGRSPMDVQVRHHVFGWKTLDFFFLFVLGSHIFAIFNCSLCHWFLDVNAPKVCICWEPAQCIWS